jgi:hypothetical protein
MPSKTPSARASAKKKLTGHMHRLDGLSISIIGALSQVSIYMNSGKG